MKQIIIIMALLWCAFISFGLFMYASSATFDSCFALSLVFMISALFVPTAFFMLTLEYDSSNCK